METFHTVTLNHGTYVVRTRSAGYPQVNGTSKLSFTAIEIAEYAKSIGGKWSYRGELHNCIEIGNACINGCRPSSQPWMPEVFQEKRVNGRSV